MAITYEGAALINSTAAVSGTVTIPAGVQAGDILVLEVQGRLTTPTWVCEDDDTGGNTWTEKASEFSGGTGTGTSNRCALFWKRATSGTASKVISLSGGSNSTAAHLLVYRGCVATGDPFDAIHTEFNLSGNEDITGITPSVDGTMVCLMVGVIALRTVTSPACTDPGALTPRSSMSNTTGNDTYVYHASALQGTAAATGTFTWAMADGTSGSMAYALAPATAGNVTASPGTAALVLTTFAPTVTATNHVTVTPAPASLTLTPVAPVVAVSDHKVVTPAPASLTLTGSAPTVTASDHITVAPAAAALVLTTFAPAVTGGAGLTLHPAPASLSLTAFAPDVVLTDHQLVTPGPAALTLATFAPDVVALAPQVVTPGPASLVLTTFAPSVATAMPAFVPRGSVATITVPSVPGATVTVPVPVASVAVPELPTAEVS